MGFLSVPQLSCFDCASIEAEINVYASTEAQSEGRDSIASLQRKPQLRHKARMFASAEAYRSNSQVRHTRAKGILLVVPECGVNKLSTSMLSWGRQKPPRVEGRAVFASSRRGPYPPGPKTQKTTFVPTHSVTGPFHCDSPEALTQHGNYHPQITVPQLRCTGA